MLYWIVANIGSPKGMVKKHQFHSLDKFSQNTIQKLLDTGTIRQIVAPPFEILAPLKNHAILLHESGCITLMDVFELGTERLQELAPELNAKQIILTIEQMLRPDTPLPDGACDCT